MIKYITYKHAASGYRYPKKGIDIMNAYKTIASIEPEDGAKWKMVLYPANPDDRIRIVYCVNTNDLTRKFKENIHDCLNRL